MKSKFLFSVLLTAGLIFANVTDYKACGQSVQDKPVKQASVTYTCPMHADVTMSAPGKCPTCGMDLKEKKEMHAGTDRHANDSTLMMHEHMNMKKDTIPMKTGKMTPDTILMKKAPMKSDTTLKKQDRLER